MCYTLCLTMLSLDKVALPSGDPCHQRANVFMQNLIFTGPTGATSVATLATAAAAVAGGSHVLLVSVGPTHPIASLLGVQACPEPCEVSPGLDLWCIEPLGELTRVWDSIKSASSSITGDELPVIPGSDLFLAVTGLRKRAKGYDLACVDGGQPDLLLRSLGAPDSIRWVVRALIGLDRGAGRSSVSVARAIIPTGLLPIPSDWIGRIQDARISFERLRDELTAPTTSQVRYVLAPDRPALAEARINIAALQLFGLAVECLIAGPILPNGLPGLEALATAQQAVMDEAGTIWHGHAVYSMPLSAPSREIAALTELGERIYDGDSPLPGAPPPPPVLLNGPPDPSVSLNLPGLPRELLGLTLSGDELIIRAGPYRRHLLLPEGLRGTTSIKASREGELLVIRPRK